MLYWIIQITIVSIILVFLVHYLINFFKSTLTVPKIKDLVNTPAQKYETMLNVIKNKSSYTDDYKIKDLLPNFNNTNDNDNEEPVTMKSELKSFLKKQLHSESSGTDILALDSMMNSNSYSNF